MAPETAIAAPEPGASTSSVIPFPHPIPPGAHRTNDAIVWGDLDDAILDRRVNIAMSPEIKGFAWKNTEGNFLSFLNLVTKHNTQTKKDGMSFAQGAIAGCDTKKGGARNQAGVTSLDLMVIDIDCGQDPEEIREAIRRQGWFAVIATSYNHMKPETSVKRDTIISEYTEDREPTIENVRAYLLAKKKYRPEILRDAELIDAKRTTPDGVMMVLRHQPLPRLRVILLLKDSFVITDQMTGRKKLHDVANLWRAKYGKVSDILGAYYDKSCTDLNRGFYFPSHPPSSTDWRIDIVPGEMLDLDAIDVGTEAEGRLAQAVRALGGTSNKDDGKEPLGKLFFKKYGERFELESFFEARYPDGHIEQRSRGGRTCKCPFIHEHTLPESGLESDDKGFYCVNAGVEGEQAIAHCQHDSCKAAKRDRIDYVGAILEREGMTWGDLGEWVPGIHGEDDFDPSLFGKSQDEEEADTKASTFTPKGYATPEEFRAALAEVPRNDGVAIAPVIHAFAASGFEGATKGQLKKEIMKHSGLGSRVVDDEMKSAAKAARKKKKAPNGIGLSWVPDGIIFEDDAFWSTRWEGIGDDRARVRDKMVSSFFKPIARVNDATRALKGLRIECNGKEVTIPVDALHSSKEQLATDLTKNYGLLCGTTRNGHDGLTELLAAALRKAELSTVIELSHPGWYFDGALFACANGKIVGKAPNGETVILAVDAGYKERAPDGVGDEAKESSVYTKVWKDGPALWRFGDLMGLASACQGVVGCRSGGFGLDGTTRHGKTTTQYLQVARAGSPDESEGRGGLLPASASPEAIEFPARNAMGNPFAMDEVQQMRDHRDLSRFIFYMAGGSGKPRMKRSAEGNRDTVTWKVISSMSTERTFKDLLRNAGKAMVGGMVSRYPSIGTTGLCDHTPANGALAEEIKGVLFANHGHTFPAFVTGLITVDWAKAVREWRALQVALPGADSYLKAPAEFFALCQWAGHQAARMGLTDGLTVENVDETVKAAWLNFAGRDEADALVPGKAEIDSLREYVATHIDRTIVECGAAGDEGTYQERAGYHDSNRYYLIAAKLDEMSGGTGNRAALVTALKTAGYLVVPKRTDGALTFTDIPGVLGCVRHYRIDRWAFVEAPEEDEATCLDAPEEASP